MADKAGYTGLSFNNLRKALYLIYFGIDNGACNDFSSPKYQYIIPMQGNFRNPLDNDAAVPVPGPGPKPDPRRDTFIMYWIEHDEPITFDSFSQEGDESWNRQLCQATVLLRFVGRDAENWSKVFRHMTCREDAFEIWRGVCAAEKQPQTYPTVPRRIAFAGLDGEAAFDVRFRLKYWETIDTGWEPLEGVKFLVRDNLQISGGVPLPSVDSAGGE